MIIYLIPFYYIVSSLASDKESKAREGMKMMGLTDGTYYLANFITHLTIVGGQTLLITLIAGLGIFTRVNMFILFLFCLFYSLCLYGWALAITALLPKKKSAGIAATLFHLISFYMSALIKSPATAPSMQYGLSILPNVCLN